LIRRVLLLLRYGLLGRTKKKEGREAAMAVFCCSNSIITHSPVLERNVGEGCLYKSIGVA